MKRTLAAVLCTAALVAGGIVATTPPANAVGECYFGDYITLSMAEYDTIQVGKRWIKTRDSIDAFVMNEQNGTNYNTRTFIGDGCSAVIDVRFRGNRINGKTFQPV